jgi:hypothetical protein
MITPIDLKRYRLSWRSLAGWAGLATLAIVTAGLYAVLRTPTWYRPPLVPPEQRQQVRNSLINAEQSFTELLRQNKTFVYHIYQEDVNRWIAMRREIYPLIDELTPPVLEDPQVIFDDDMVTIAGRYRSTMNLIVSLDIETEFKNGQLVFKAHSARCGSVRAPIDLRRLRVDGRADSLEGGLWPGSPRITGNLIDGIFVDAHAWWKNGGIDYQVLEFSALPGELVLKVQPLGRHFRSPGDESTDKDQP